MDASFLGVVGITCESTDMLAVHMSILSPGEVIHFFTFYSNSTLDLRERSPRRGSFHPE